MKRKYLKSSIKYAAKAKDFWYGFNPAKIFLGYKKIKLTEKEKGDVFFNTNCLETNVMGRIVAKRTGIPYGIVDRILNNAEYDVMGQVGLIHDYK